MITYKIYTDVGGREINEDSVGMLEDNGRYCFTLADGLGGHGRGECASAIAVKTALEMFAEEFDESFLEKHNEQSAGKCGAGRYENNNGKSDYL